MKVFKFGGASLRHAAAIKNAAHIIEQHKNSGLLVVGSAIGKTTNALEKIVELLTQGLPAEKDISTLHAYHIAIMDELFGPGDGVYGLVKEQFASISQVPVYSDADRFYDEIVSKGEIISTLILSNFIGKTQPVVWVDARQFVITNSNFREGRVDWQTTSTRIQTLSKKVQDVVHITQGFIGMDAAGHTTTLGREGSDYTAAIFGSCLHAESVTIWKDVPGVMNADPKRFDGAVVFEELPFKEAAEMTYYGASVIHPKTIKPLANAEIPLLVRNFDNPSLPGTIIHNCTIANLPPLVVLKENQCLISCKVTDFSFIEESQISVIFESVAKHDIRINMMQNSAISFSMCMDYRESRVQTLIKALGNSFEVYYNTGLTLLTVKNYDNKIFNRCRAQPGIVLEQTSRSTLQLLVRAGAGPDHFRISSSLLPQ